ncbi:hypothetical protein F5890DRAFT_367320 [Lentinula detonsa]|uniref:Protein CPL1-like domain-containing protein n=1 Tax=Lentinula detonsa TaxID=2804962 RepID=A0AA38PVG5_9AGAR|nr:hypothetical protein F5890DRAFT_367320 [Lentinula detonsa]
MRLKSLIPTFLLSLPLFYPSVDALRRHRETGQRLPLVHEREVVSQRQHRPQHFSPRDLIDICINLDAVVDGNPLLEELFAGIHLCLCLKDLDIFLDTYVGLDILGLRALVEAELKDFFHSQPACDPVPAHAHRACTTEDPCSCSCDSGFTKIGGECVCPAPNSICNGVCGHFPHGCGGRPSALPRSLKKRAVQELTFADAQAYCGEKRVCGVHGGSEHAFECVDIETSSDSCGGCLYAHPWSQTSMPVLGLDCSSLSSPQAISHRCESGRCVVNTCAKGYIAGPDGCVPSSRIVLRMALGAPGPVILPGSDAIIDSSSSNITPGAPTASSNTDVSSSNALGSLGSLNNFTDAGATSTVLSTSSSGNEDYGNGNSNNEGLPFTPATSCTTSSSSSGNANLIDSLLGGLGLRKRSQDPCQSSTPLPPTPSPSPSDRPEPCPDDTGAPAPSSGNESSSGDDIVADLSPLAEADVDLGPGLNEATTGVAAGLGLGKVIYPGRLVSGKREEDCDCEDGHGSTGTDTFLWLSRKNLANLSIK